jgi:hypothetical protein
MQSLSAHTDEATASQGDLAAEDAVWTAGRALLDKVYEDILDRGLANYTPRLAHEAPEDELLAEAVRMTRKKLEV